MTKVTNSHDDCTPPFPSPVVRDAEGVPIHPDDVPAAASYEVEEGLPEALQSEDLASYLARVEAELEEKRANWKETFGPEKRYYYFGS